ncbi:MAG: AhpC/TSA family protein [Prevotella sp.]|nr:AhpC/TSA family protein [Prevotella sp.]
MRNIIISISMLAAIQTGCAAEDNIHVKGNMKNTGDTLLVLTADTENNPQTVVVNDGKFEFDFKLDKIDRLFCISPALMRGQDGVNINFVAVPGESVTLTGDANGSYDISGSQFYKDFNELDKARRTVMDKQNELGKRCNAMLMNGAPQDSVARVFQKENKPIIEEMEQTVTNFIRTHSNSEAAAAAITYLPANKMRKAVALLSNDVKNGRMKPFYQGIIDRYEAQQKAEEQSSQLQAPGREAPDFTLNDINGRPLALSSLRGKYVILDFWGSWCGWCIKGFPQMKEYYNKYKGQFEILGIDCNDPEQKWRDAVAKNELPWLHVYNPRDSKVLADYGIQGFPTKIILGPDGKIVKTIVGEDPEFYTLLDQLFGAK